MNENCKNLLSENIKKLLNHQDNRKNLEYFLETFLNIPHEKIAGKLKVYYDTILNTVSMTKTGICSDLIVMYDNVVIKIKSYETIHDEYIIHILLGTLNDEYGKLVELRYVKESEYDKIVANFSLRNAEDPDNKLFENLLKIKVFDLNRLDQLDNNTPQNRWIKFIGAKNKEERLDAAKNDQYLMALYKWLED